ncbi:MAG: hypothetical protein AAF466_13615 [Bacteroidota bacterium]
MKRLLLLLALVTSLGTFAQNTYTVDGKDYPLNTEVEGTLTLLWNTIDGNYRYFAKKGSTFTELKNTRGDRDYLEEYKQVLADLTSDQNLPVDKVKLTLVSLRKFVNSYNKAVDPSFVEVGNPVQLEARLGVFAGMTNYPYFVNPGNDLLPQLGVDFEIIDNARLKRHGIVFQFRQLLSTSDFDLSSSQFSLNHRFKFVNCETFAVFINTKIASYVHLSQDIPDPDGDGDTDDAISGSGGEFQAPFAFGVGADIALGNGHITLGLYDLLALNLEDNGEFPTDFVVGYKFNL